MRRTRLTAILWLLLLSLTLGSIGFDLHPPLARAAPEAAVVTLSGSRIMQAPLAVADFNGDGRLEIVAGGSDGKLYVIAFEGSTPSVVWSRQTAVDLNAAGPPKPSSTSDIRSAPAIADLDNDGRLEIVVSTGGDPANHVNGSVLVYSYNSPWSFALKSGWPQPRIDDLGNPPLISSPDGYWDGIWSSPGLGDIDGDGDLEVVVETFNKRIFAWHHSGTPVGGWPIHRSSGDALLRGGWSSPALGDIDQDGLPEVVVGTNSPPWEGEGGPSPDYTKATLWAINGDSTNVPGFPVVTDQWIQSSPALGDLDNDGALEIIVGTGTGIPGDAGHKVYAWNGDGSALPNWPRPTGGYVPASPALGDIDGDGALEVVVGCGGEADVMNPTCKTLYAWNGDGTNVPGFPTIPEANNPWSPSSTNALPYSPILSDYDGDGSIEILVNVAGSWGVSTVDANGRLGNNPALRTGNVLYAPPVVADVDDDGHFEVLVGGGDESGSRGTVHIWDLSGSASGPAPWLMFQRDSLRTGCHPFAPQLWFPEELRFMQQPGADQNLIQYATLKNLGGGEFAWYIANPISALKISPTSGTVSTQTEVRFVLDAQSFRPGKWQKLGDLTISGMLNDDHVGASPQQVPVWLYIGDLDSVFMPHITTGY
jgi:hypothetical protein